MMDPIKQREMEVKVTQSQQKITEWQEELKHLKGLSNHFVKALHVCMSLKINLMLNKFNMNNIFRAL